MEDERTGNRPLRICLLSYRSNPHCGGQGVYLKNLALALKGLGHRVEVVSGPPDPQIGDGVPVHRLPSLDLYDPADPFRIPRPREVREPINLIEWLGVSTMGFPEPFTFGLRAWRFLRPAFSRYDVVHDNQSLSYGLWAIAKRVPTVATIHHPITVDRALAVSSVHSFWEKSKQLRWYSFLGMQKQVSRTLKRIITVSGSARDDISRDFDIPVSRFRVVPNGIDTGQFHPLPGVRRDPQRVIVTNSADTPLKGLLHLLRAVDRIASRRKIRLVVVGTPKENGEVVRLIRRLGIGPLVTFTGRIDGRAFVRHYARAAVAVVPSVYEGFGLPAGEAMACGVPVVSTTGGALPEVIGKAGVLVPPADPGALASAVEGLLDHPDRAARLGAAGLQRVHRHFTWRRAAEKTTAVYREVLRGHG